MRYVAAYLLANLGGSNNPTAAELEKILGSVGIEAEKDKITKIIGELKGKNLDELIEEGQKKLATVPSGGGGGGAAAAAAPAAGGDAKEAKKEEKKEESESEDEDMGFGLFD